MSLTGEFHCRNIGLVGTTLKENSVRLAQIFSIRDPQSVATTTTRRNFTFEPRNGNDIVPETARCLDSRKWLIYVSLGLVNGLSTWQADDKRMKNSSLCDEKEIAISCVFSEKKLMTKFSRLRIVCVWADGDKTAKEIPLLRKVDVALLTLIRLSPSQSRSMNQLILHISSWSRAFASPFCPSWWQGRFHSVLS